jgi:TetR/AcrR family transcriptional repressor of lmrAB and yxaGH operons
MNTTTRQQIIKTTSDLLELQGYYGTGLNQIIKESGAPRGSLYYYFPDGKEELAAEAIAEHGQERMAHTRAVLAAHGDVGAAIFGLIMGIAQHLTQGGCTSGAPLAAVSLETASTSERLRAVCRASYEQQALPIEEKLVSSGYQAALAAQLTTLIVSAIEGAIILCRVRQEATPLEDVAQVIKTLLDSTKPA